MATFFLLCLDTAEEFVDELSISSFDTFKTKFKQVFRKVVPAGRVRIEVQEVNVSMGTQANGQTEKGLTLLASFGDQGGADDDDEGMRQMMNLSPGQKTVIAICMLFAFQELCPASFYCFDEICADLDTSYVEKVASM